MATCELIWIKQLLKELKVGDTEGMEPACDNEFALHIAFDQMFHEITKHIQIDYHFVRERVLWGDTVKRFVGSCDKFADIFTESLTSPRTSYICNKIGTYNMYAPA